MKIGILGSGEVGKALAVGFLERGDHVIVGTRDMQKHLPWIGEHPKAILGSFADAATFGEIVVLAVKGSAVSDAIWAADPSNLAAKTVIDVTNPIADDKPPVNGVIPFFTDFDESLMERLQRQFPKARFVKAFNSVGSDLMVKPSLPGGPPTMFICGNDEEAKKSVAAIVESFGWQVADMGKAEAARAIEPLAMLWCIPGFLRGDWSHAFKMLG